MGTPDFAVPSLKLVASNFNVIAVFSQPARPNGRGMKTKKSPVEITARELNLKCKLVQILLSLRKQTHNICNSNNFIWIPLVPLNQEWNNDKLYKYFELDNNDITMIRDLKLDGSYIK